MKARIVTGQGPISEEEMLKMYQVNQEFRTPERMVHNNWWVTAKDAQWELVQALNHQTKLFLKPKYWTQVPEWTVEIMEDILKWRWVMRPTRDIRKDEKENLLWWLMRTDIHADELDHKNNTMKKRLSITNERTKRVVDRLMRFDPDRLMVAQMGDLFNSDKWYRTSSGKVHVQNNIHEKDAFRRILDWTIDQIEQLKTLGIPIEYRIVPWNHDNLVSDHYWVACEYALGIPVTIDKDRAYIQRGDTLIALWHWDNEKPWNFLQFVVDEFLTKYKKSIKHLHWYLWNQHQQIVSQNWPMMIKNLLAPNPRSTRTASKGYDMRQGMHWFVWDKKDGEIAEVRG